MFDVRSQISEKTLAIHESGNIEGMAHREESTSSGVEQPNSFIHFRLPSRAHSANQNNIDLNTIDRSHLRNYEQNWYEWYKVKKLCCALVLTFLGNWFTITIKCHLWMSIRYVNSGHVTHEIFGIIIISVIRILICICLIVVVVGWWWMVGIAITAICRCRCCGWWR